MGITTALAAPEPIQFLILLIQEGLVVGGLLIVDLLVEVLEGFQLPPDVRFLYPAEGLFAKFHFSQRLGDILHGMHRRLLPTAALTAHQNGGDQGDASQASSGDHEGEGEVVFEETGGGANVAGVGEEDGNITN